MSQIKTEELEKSVNQVDICLSFVSDSLQVGTIKKMNKLMQVHSQEIKFIHDDQKIIKLSTKSTNYSQNKLFKDYHN